MRCARSPPSSAPRPAARPTASAAGSPSSRTPSPSMSEAKNLFVVDGPLSRHKLAVLRDERTPTTDFRQGMRELSLIMVAEATRRMPTRQETIRTPLTQTEVEQISGPVCLVPVLRAGLGMLDGALALLPRATVGFMGLQRDEETALPVEYYVNLPRNLEEYLVLVLDPMLATGGSLSATIDKLKEEGAAWISCLHAVAAVPGVERVTAEHPDVNFYTAAVDPELDERSFIVPRLGDAGDRPYGTTHEHRGDPLPPSRRPRAGPALVYRPRPRRRGRQALWNPLRTPRWTSPASTRP